MTDQYQRWRWMPRSLIGLLSVAVIALGCAEMCCYNPFPSDMCICEDGFWACDPHWDCF